MDVSKRIICKSPEGPAAGRGYFRRSIGECRRHFSGCAEPCAVGPGCASLDDFVAIAAYFQVPTAYLLNQPPFDAWEQALKRKTAVLEALARMLPFPAESLADLHLPAFLFVYNAAFRRAEYDPDRQTLTLYPSFSKGAPITLS